MNDEKNNSKPKLLFVSDDPIESKPTESVNTSDMDASDISSSDINTIDIKLPQPESPGNSQKPFIIPKPTSDLYMPDDEIAEDAARDVIPYAAYDAIKSAPPTEKPNEKPPQTEPSTIPEKNMAETPVNQPEQKVHKKSWVIRVIQWLLIWGIIICVTLMIALAGFLYILKQNIPDFSSLKDYHPPETTQVLDSRKNVIAEFFHQRRFVKPLRLIPKRLIQAFLSAEDARFYDHQGYDLRSIIRAAIKNLIAGKIVQGGSTITQQTARSFLIARHKTYMRKLQELILAYQLEQTFSKDHILYLYLNQIYLGYGAYGVEAAAQNYFGKSINQLSIAECAALAGLPQAPARYAPDKNFKAFKARQKYVLKRMYNDGFITDVQARQAYDQRLNIFPRKNRFAENAPYFSEHVRIAMEKQLGSEALNSNGLTIYTTLDMRMQQTAQKALKKGLTAIEKRHKYPKSQPPLQGALICMDIQNGHIKAMVGGRDFSKSKFNRAVQAIRQPGSAFKPIIYSTALDSGFTPASIIVDAPIVMADNVNDSVWKPNNYEKTFYGPTTLRRALALSRNLVTIKLLQKVGIENVITNARQLGISSPIQKDLSIALGSSGVTLIELVRAYAVFASGGDLIEPVCVKKIENKQKEKIEMPATTKRKKVMEKSTAYCMTHMLQAVVKQGTAQRVKSLKRPIAGKTGSTNNLYDAWFIGYSPRYLTGVWVGFDQPQSIGEKETGARAAIPIWLSFMKDILGREPVRQFAIPSGVVFSKIDADTGTLPTSSTKKTVYECFKEGTGPNPLNNQKGGELSRDSFFKELF